MACTIQWKIADYLTFAVLLQKISRAGHDKTLPAVIIIFVESKHFLQDNIFLDTDSLFCDFTTAIGTQDSERMKAIILTLYDNNYQTKKSKAPTPYHAVEPRILWFINTTGCHCYLALAYFMSKSFFKGAIHMACCDFCIYGG